MKIVHVRAAAAVTAMAAMFALAACGGGEKQEGAGATTAGAGASATASAPGGGAQPAAGGTVHEVDMITDPTDGSNKFVPNDLTVKQGDVIRYTLKMGVHNVHFLPDSNPGKAGLPPASELLQAPGQTHDVAVTFGPGKYYFQCDPHAALGMTGHVTVQ